MRSPRFLRLKIHAFHVKYSLGKLFFKNNFLLYPYFWRFSAMKFFLCTKGINKLRFFYLTYYKSGILQVHSILLYYFIYCNIYKKKIRISLPPFNNILKHEIKVLYNNFKFIFKIQHFVHNFVSTEKCKQLFLDYMI